MADGAGKPKYAYRVFPPDQIKERLNEARGRGWEFHTSCDAVEAEAYVVFKWVGYADQYKSPFADDDKED